MTNASAHTSAPSTARRPRCSVGEMAARLLRPGDTMLAVWAHPDDESYLGAGLMAAAAERGARVRSVSASLGEQGTDDPSTYPPERLAVIRRGELHRALDALGAEPALLLGLQDGCCHDVDDVHGVSLVGQVIDDEDPRLVLTFGPDGVTGHDDHRAVARWTRQAVAARGDRVPLLATAAGCTWPRDLVDRMHTVSMFYPGHPIDVSGAVHVQLDDDMLARKLAALSCHHSQIGPLREALGEAGYRAMAAHEAYAPLNAVAELRLGWSSPLANLAA